MARPLNWNEHDDWDDSNYHVYYETPDDRTVYEDYGLEWLDTGLLDSQGRPISKRNSRAKDRIGFAIPSRMGYSPRDH